MSLRIVIKEFWAVLRVMTLARLLNSLLVLTGYLLSFIVRRPVLIRPPFAFAIEPTSLCNLKCPECPTGANLLMRPRGMIAIDSYKKIVDDLQKQTWYLNLYVQGEPFMHPQITQMISHASQRKMYVSTSTNGHFINKDKAEEIVASGLTRLIFSVDGVTQESYSQYRVGGELKKVTDAIKNVVAAREKVNSQWPFIVMQFLVFRHNEHELTSIRRLAKTLKVDKLEIKTAQLNDFGSMLPPENLQLSRYADKKGKQMKFKRANHCWKQWHSSVMTWDGRVAPCCYDKDADYLFARLPQEGINKIWKGDNCRMFKQQILHDRNKIEMCRNCPEGRSLF